MLFLNMYVRILRVKNENKPGVLAKVLSIVGENNGYIGEIRTLHYGNRYVIRDIEVMCKDEGEFKNIQSALSKLSDVEVLAVRDDVLELHVGGKLEVKTKVVADNVGILRRIYTPGVANVAKLIRENPELVDEYTWRSKTVGIFTNGTRVLGLGDIGVIASLPVMEGKAALLNQLVGLYGIPVLVNDKTVDGFVETVIKVSEGFGAIHLEDIRTPDCFEIEERLINSLEKPVMHDDQHGTAVVTLAAAINACGLAHLNINRIQFGQIGLGASGMAISRLIMEYTNRPVLGYDIKEEAVERFKRYGGTPADMEEIFRKCDFVISATAVPELIKPEYIRKGQIIFALSNPVPEIDPELAMKSGAIFASDGKVINNILAYPGIFKGALKVRAKRIIPEMLVVAAETIARCAPQGDLLPNPLNKEVHRKVAFEVGMEAMRRGVARRELDEEIKGV